MKRIKGRRGKGSSRSSRTRATATTRVRRQPAKPYQFLDHPADVGFVARGRSLADVFVAAAEAMCAYGWEPAHVRARETIDIRVRAASLEDLLYSWLSELLFLSDAEQWLFKSFSVKRVSTLPARGKGKVENLWSLAARAQGERFDRRRHRARTYIKAVTYHQLSVKEMDTGWQATIYLDV